MAEAQEIAGADVVAEMVDAGEVFDSSIERTKSVWDVAKALIQSVGH